MAVITSYSIHYTKLYEVYTWDGVNIGNDETITYRVYDQDGDYAEAVVTLTVVNLSFFSSHILHPIGGVNLV